MALDVDQRIAETVERERSRLGRFIRRRVPDPRDAEDILQDVFVAFFIFAGGTVAQMLWNWLLPPLFGWREVTFWQALGLLALCRILFGGFGSHGGSRSSIRRRMAEKMGQRMTGDERDRFRQRMRERFGFDPNPEGRTEL